MSVEKSPTRERMEEALMLKPRLASNADHIM